MGLSRFQQVVQDDERDTQRAAKASIVRDEESATRQFSRGGVEGFIEEWEEYGWRLTAHKQMSLEAAQQWRLAEGDLVAHHTRYEMRYGKRGYLHELDVLAELVRSYTTHEQGHGIFVFKREP